MFIHFILVLLTLRNYNFFLILFSGCESHTFNSDVYWECAIRHVSSTLYHQIGTCKMGPPNDTKSVVDPELKVIGIKNLRVVDVSIMPTPIAGHTSLPAYMIGEKVADMIKNTWS